MSQTSQQEHGAAAAEPRRRKDWEPFWRIIAGLMLIVIVWVLWVLYQITPRSVVTPLAYEPRTKSIGTAQTPANAAAADAPLPPASATQATSAAQPAAPGPAELPRATGVSAADLALEQAQAAARAGAHQSSADVQAAALEKMQEELQQGEPVKMEGLKLSTEITTPLGGKKKNAERAGGSPGAALPDSAGKARP
jgi:hypothetical protein